MDMKAICDALAAKYAPGTLATPSGAQNDMRGAYGQAPHSMPNTPAVVVMPQTGEIVMESQAWSQTHQIDVVFMLSKAPGDIERVELQRQIWLPSLLTAVVSFGMTLGLAGTVKSAVPVGYEFTEYPYGGESYDAIVIHYEVTVREAVTMVQ